MTLCAFRPGRVGGLPALIAATLGAGVLFAPAGLAWAQPIPSIHYRYTRAITGWLPNWLDVNGTGDGWKSVQANANMVDEVSFFAFEADPQTGDLTAPGKNMLVPSLVQQVGWLHTRETAALFTVTQFNHVHDMLSDPARLDHLIQNIVKTANLYGFDGVDIDFEDFKKGDPGDTARYTDFVNKLADAMHSQVDAFGFPKMAIATVLSQTQRGSFSYIDYASLGESRLDRIRVMAYDDYYPGSKSAGAGAPLSWYAQVASYIKSLGVPEWKFTMGIPGYAYKWAVNGPDDWTTLGRGSSVTYPQAIGLIAEHNATRAWDKTSATPYFSYKAMYTPPKPVASPADAPPVDQVTSVTKSPKPARANQPTAAVPAPASDTTPPVDTQPVAPPTPPQPGIHTWVAYYEDAQSWKMKVQNVLLASQLNGLAEWALGYEDPASWPMLQHSLSPLYPIYGAVGLCYWRFGGGA
ncbi:MAG TPA: glycosyl hydrolase family 18 protein, partial [Capsulimonadaceae bacterium]|nr:glycosyl hydrolase family 18 protein [Capsulimonadaceae bacterium]